jgi:hypothetical protein
LEEGEMLDVSTRKSDNLGILTCCKKVRSKTGVNAIYREESEGT